MAELTMDNPLATQPQLHKVAQDTIDCIVELKREFNETKTPINDDNQTLHRFCAKLEHLLKAEMKEKTSLLGRKKDYYDFFCDCLSSTKGLNDGIKFVKSTGEYKTSLGRGRAFIRFSLVHQRLADTVQQCVMNGRTASDWYTTRSVWLNHHQKSAIIAALYDLNELNFDLMPRGYDLDNAWPSFSKKMGFPQGNWNPPSRASSYSSLASLPIQEPFVPRERRDTTSTTMSEVDLEVSDRSALEERLEQLELTNDNMSETLAARNQDLAQISTQLNEALERCKLLGKELEVKEQVWSEKETDFKTKKTELNEKLKILDEKLEEVRSYLLDAEKKLTVKECEFNSLHQEKEKLAEELRVAQSSSGDSEEIGRLEIKVTTLEQKNAELVSKLEGLVLARDSEASNQLDAASRLQSTLQDLRSSEEENIRLRSSLEEGNNNIAGLTTKLAQTKQVLSDTQQQLKETEKSLKILQTSWGDKEHSFIEKQNETSHRLEDVLSELSSSRTSSEQLEVKLQERRNEISGLKEEVSGMKEQHCALEERLTQQAEEKTLLEECLAGGENLHADLEVRLQSLTTELEERTSALTQLTQEKQLAEEAKERLEGELANQKADLSDQVMGLNKLLAEKEDGIEKLVNELCGRLEENQSTDSLDRVKIKLTDDEKVTEKLRLLENLLENQRLSLKDSELKSVNLHSDLTSLQQESSQQGRQLESLKQEIQQLKEMNDALQNNETDARSRSEKDAAVLELKDERIAVLEREVRENQDRIAELEATIREKSEDIAKKNQELVEMSSSVTQTRAELQTSSQQREVGNKEMKHLQEKCDLIQKNLLLETSNIEKLKTENSELSEEKGNLDKKIMQYENELQNLRELSATEKRDIIGEMEKQLEASHSKFMDERKEKLTALDNLTLVNNQLVDVQEEMTLLKSKCDRLSEETQTLQSQADLLLTEKQKALDEVLEANTAGEALLKLVAERDKTIASLQENVAERDKTIASLQDNMAERDKTIASLQDNMAERDKTIASLQDNVAERDKTIASLQDNVTERDKTIASLQDNVTELEKAYEMAKETNVASFQERDSRLENLSAEVESWKSAAENEKDASLVLREEREHLSSEVERLQRELEAKGEELEVKGHELEVKGHELEGKGQELDTKQSDLENMEKQLAAKCQELDAMREELQGKTTELERKSEEFEEVSQQLASKDEQVQAKTAELDAVQEELSARGEEENATEVLRIQWAGERRALESEAETQQQEIQALRFQLSSQQLQHEQAIGKYLEQEADVSSVTERMGEQERLIEQLEAEMGEIKQAREQESRQNERQLTDTKLALQAREEEFQLLSSKVVQLTTDLADESNKTSLLSHDLELSQMVEKTLEKVKEENSALKKDNSVLKSDTHQLKKKLVRLIKEKDALWQKTDSLVYEQRIHAAETWMEDSKVTNCLGCRIEFSFTTRKHHCRLCGRIYCWNCSNNWVMTAHSNKKARVCNGCYIRHNETDGKMDSSLVGEESDDDEALTRSSPGVRRGDDSASQGSRATSPSLDLSGVLSGDTDSLTSTDIRDTSTPDSMADAARYSGNETDDNKQGKQLSVSTPYDREFSSTTDELTASPAVTSPDDSEREDNFHVISEEEIEKSLSGSLTSPPPSLDQSMSVGLTITVDDLEKGHVNRDNDVWLRAGKRFAVPILVNKVGVVLCWEFSTQPKDIGFSATYSQSELTPTHEAHVLIQPCKCNSHKQTVRGELTAKKHGIYTLMFDNTYSKFTTKKLSYSLYLKTVS